MTYTQKYNITTIEEVIAEAIEIGVACEVVTMCKELGFTREFAEMHAAACLSLMNEDMLANPNMCQEDIEYENVQQMYLTECELVDVYKATCDSTLRSALVSLTN